MPSDGKRGGRGSERYSVMNMGHYCTVWISARGENMNKRIKKIPQKILLMLENFFKFYILSNFQILNF